MYELCDEDELLPPPKEFSWIVRKFNEQTQVVAEKTIQVGTGTPEDPKILLISADLDHGVREALVSLLKGYTDAFTWSYEDMSGLDPELVEHRLVLHLDAKLVKQKLRRMHPQVVLQVKEEIDKLHKDKFIRVVVYPQWVANIVAMQKKDGRVCISIDL